MTLAALRCPPESSGTPSERYPDLWSGAGTIGYAQSTSGESCRHSLVLQANPDFGTVSITGPDECCGEVTRFPLACFRIVPAANASVPAKGALQLFGATLHVVGEHTIPIATQRIWFAVPGG